jgi:hypothetical protein
MSTEAARKPVAALTASGHAPPGQPGGPPQQPPAGGRPAAPAATTAVRPRGPSSRGPARLCSPGRGAASPVVAGIARGSAAEHGRRPGSSEQQDLTEEGRQQAQRRSRRRHRPRAPPQRAEELNQPGHRGIQVRPGIAGVFGGHGACGEARPTKHPAGAGRRRRSRSGKRPPLSGVASFRIAPVVGGAHARGRLTGPCGRNGPWHYKVATTPDAEFRLVQG